MYRTMFPTDSLFIRNDFHRKQGGKHLNFLREIFADTNICFVHNSPRSVSLGMYFSGIPPWIYEFSSPYLVYLFSVQFFRQDGGTTFTNRLQLLNLEGKYCFRFGTLECSKKFYGFVFKIVVYGA